MPARKLSEILSGTPELGTLADSAHLAAQLQRIYLEAVPPELAESSRVGGSRAGVLIVTARNGAIASKLRQVTPRVLDRFRQRGFEFNSMRIRVQVGDSAASAPPGPARKSLSPQAMAAIREALATTPDSPLKAALARLARRR